MHQNPYSTSKPSLTCYVTLDLFSRSLCSQQASEEAIAAAMAPADDDPEALTEEEGVEREQLLDSGFKDWSRK